MSAEIFFKETGYNKGYGGSMHITDMSKGIMGMNGIVGASYYMAAGAALRAHGARTPSRWRWRSSATAPSASPYYFSAIRSCANLKMPVIFVNENNFQYMGVPMALTVPTKYISEYTKGLDIPHHLVDGNDVVGGVRRDAGSGRVGARRQGSEHDRRHHLSLVRPRRVRRRPGRPGRRRWGCRTAPTKKCGSGCRAIRSSRYKKWLLAKGLASEAELAEDRHEGAGGGRRVGRVRAQERRSGSRGRRAEHLRQGRGRGDAVLQPKRAASRPRPT